MLTPIEVAIEDVQKKIGELEAATNQVNNGYMRPFGFFPHINIHQEILIICL